MFEPIMMNFFNIKNMLFKYIMDKIIVCLPTRINSSRLPKQLLKKFGDKTCIELTYLQCLKSKYVTKNNIYIFTDSNEIELIMKNYTTNIIKYDTETTNGTDALSKHLKYLPDKYEFIVNIQGDEPYINPNNIDLAIEKFLQEQNDNFSYLTLHNCSKDINKIKQTSSVKLVTDINNNVLLYTRNVIPFNKDGVMKDIEYKLFIGIYVWNKKYLELYKDLENTFLQMEEDIEQLKILENGYIIKSYPSNYITERSLDTIEDYNYLISKYITNNIDIKQDF